MFLLSSPAWPLPIYSDLWTWCSRFQCKIVLCSIRFYFHPWTYPLLSIFFASSFFLELFLCSSPTAYQTPSDLGGSSSGVIFFVFFIPFMKFLRREYWSGLPFPPPVDQVLSELLTMSCLSWVALHGMAHSFTDLHKPLCYVKVVNHEGENLLYTPTGMYTVAD